MAVYSIWGVANRIKVESLDKAETVQDSIFEEVYRKADRLFFEIIREMQQIADNDNIWDDQIANVVSFLGGRGRGKTSAMLSFYSYLAKLKRHGKEAWGEWKKLKDKKLKFVEIPCIDAAALAQNEFIIEVILAKMWDGFDVVIKENPHTHDSRFEYLIRNVRTRFVNVQKSYTILRDKETNKVREEEISAASALHELAASMNFKEEFEKLVQDYIKVLNYEQYDRYKEDEPGYLVLAIDDIDMAGNKAQSILEQIRRFLSIPQVVVFLTADIERLKNVCEAFYQTVYPQGKNLKKFVSEYLEKILPTNQRIYMPDLSENQKDIPIDKNGSKFEKLQLQSSCEKEMILELMAEKCGIYFDGVRRKRHFLQNDSLRSLVNYFNNIVDMEENEYTSWLKNDLRERIAERVENEKQKEFIKSILTKDYEDINSLVLNFLKKTLKDDKEINLKDNSMGQVLYACSVLENESTENIDFINCILLLYGIILNQVNGELRAKIIGSSVWGEWEYGALAPSTKNAGFISGFENRAKMVFRLTEEVKEHIRNSHPIKALEILLDDCKSEIMAWLYAVSFVDISKTNDYVFEIERASISEDKPNEGLKQEPRDAPEHYIISPNIWATKSLFGCLHRDVDSYKDTLKRFWGSAVTALSTRIFTDAEQKITVQDIQEIKKKYMHYIDEMGIEQGNPRLNLWQSVEIIYSIGREIGNENLTDVGDTENLYEKMVSRYKIIAAELRQRDNYYMNNIGMVTTFEQDFMERFQVKIFLEPDILSPEIRKAFIDRFTLLFRGNVVSLSKTR